MPSENVYTNVIKMLKARGYGDIEDVEHSSLSEDHAELFSKVTKCLDKDGVAIMILFLDEKRLNICAVRAIVQYLGMLSELSIGTGKKKQRKCHGIVIHEETPTSSGTHQLSTLGSTGCCTVELFKESFFYNCVMEHDLVPLHEKTSKTEAESLKKTLGVGKMMQLISTFPISRFYDFKPGDIIKVTRLNGSIAYREVRK